MKNMFKVTILAAASATLIGCGGGGGDSSPKNENLVDGTFHYVSETSKAFQRFDGMTGEVCENASRYFESDNVMVFSAASHSDTDHRRVATKTEDALKFLVPKFGFASLEEFMASKPMIAHTKMKEVTEFLSDFIVVDPDTSQSSRLLADELSSYFDGRMPVGHEAWADTNESPVDHKILIYNTLAEEQDKALVADVLIEMLVSAETISGDPGRTGEIVADLQESIVHDKVQICLMPDGNSAEATSVGWNIPGNLGTEFYRHEGTHYFQKQLAHEMPRWFTEGQATVFAGQEVASGRASFTVTDVIAFADDLMWEDAYAYYGLAYKGVEANNSVETINQFLIESGLLLSGEGRENPRYDMAKAAFEDNIVGDNGADITYDEFEATYHQLAN